ncbi:MAG: lysophospholipid acyltransferase family protein [Luteibaculaceae bacterium]
MLKKDPFGNFIFLKKIIIFFFGVISWARFNRINKTVVKGAENLTTLPKSGVLFVSNHQTYFADVACMLHVLIAANRGYINKLGSPLYLLHPLTNVYFVAAKETMKSGLLPKIFAYVGAIQVTRTWRAKGEEVKRERDTKDTDNIRKALDHGWVITFPQGTTSPFQAGRKGTAHIIQDYNPIVVPIVIDGFRRAFDKKGLSIKKKGVNLRVLIKPPLHLKPEDDVDVILGRIMNAIEQSSDFDFFNAPDEKPDPFY